MLLSKIFENNSATSHNQISTHSFNQADHFSGSHHLYSAFRLPLPTRGDIRVPSADIITVHASSNPCPVCFKSPHDDVRFPDVELTIRGAGARDSPENRSEMPPTRSGVENQTCKQGPCRPNRRSWRVSTSRRSPLIWRSTCWSSAFYSGEATKVSPRNLRKITGDTFGVLYKHIGYMKSDFYAWLFYVGLTLHLLRKKLINQTPPSKPCGQLVMICGCSRVCQQT